jgi:hypothetical protein
VGDVSFALSLLPFSRFAQSLPPGQVRAAASSSAQIKSLAISVRKVQHEESCKAPNAPNDGEGHDEGAGG